MTEFRIPSNVIPPFTLDIPMPPGVKPLRRSSPPPDENIATQDTPAAPATESSEIGG
jgi:hypothetical protein